MRKAEQPHPSSQLLSNESSRNRTSKADTNIQISLIKISTVPYGPL